MLKVENLMGRSGKVANQFRISGDGKDVFQSYESTIITVDYTAKTITIGEDYDYSRTTGKYRNQFMELIGLYALNTLKKLNTAIDAGSIVWRGDTFTIITA